MVGMYEVIYVLHPYQNIFLLCEESIHIYRYIHIHINKSHAMSLVYQADSANNLSTRDSEKHDNL